MKIGLIADTHDNLEAIDKAIEVLNEKNVEHVLHAGDLISPFSAVKFGDLEADLHYVWGNNDGDRMAVISKFEDLDLGTYGDFGSFRFDGVRIALLHGVNEGIVEALAESKKYDVVVRGHTHERKVKKDPFVVNPGTVSGYVSDEKTMGILDTEDMGIEIVEL